MSDPPEVPPIEAPDPPPVPIPPPAQQAQVEIVSRLVLAVGMFPSGSPDPATIEIMDLDEEAWAEFQAAPPGSKYLAPDGTLTVVPPPPPPLLYTATIYVDVQKRTTDDVVTEIHRITMGDNVIHKAAMSIIGIDAVSFASRAMDGHFVHRRRTAGAIQVGIVVVSDIPNPPTAPTNAWAANAVPSGNDVVFTVKGALGRTVDWTLTGTVLVYAPAGK